MRNPFLELIQPDVEVPGTFWATVVGTSPLRVQRDTEPVLAVTPKTLEKVGVGDRVLCLWERRQVIILGRMGGPSQEVAYPAPNTVRIGGADYLLSGSVTCPAHTWSKYADVYVATVNVPVPYAPPFPWTFAWSVQESLGFSFASSAGRFPVGGTHSVRLLQIGNSNTSTIQRLQWQLVNA